MNIAYVSLVTEDKIFVEDIDQVKLEQLKSLHIHPDDQVPMRWVIRYSSEPEKIVLFTQLRDMGIAFSMGGMLGWGPAEQFGLFREKRLLNGKYICIAWRGPNDPFIMEK